MSDNGDHKKGIITINPRSTTTPILGLTAPTVGDTTNAWANQLNQDMYLIDPLGATIAPAAANTVWAGPVSGAAAAAGFRALVAADIPGGVGGALPSLSPNQVLAGPASGSTPATAAGRALVAADIPGTLNPTLFLTTGGTSLTVKDTGGTQTAGFDIDSSNNLHLSIASGDILTATTTRSSFANPMAVGPVWPAAGYDLDVTASAANGGTGHFAKQVVIDSTLDGALTINQNTVSNSWLRLTQSGAHLWEAYLKTTDLSFYSVDSHADVLLIDPHGVGIGNIPAAGYDLDVTSSATNGGTLHVAKSVTVDTGPITVPTPTAGDNSTKVATTAFVANATSAMPPAVAPANTVWAGPAFPAAANILHTYTNKDMTGTGLASLSVSTTTPVTAGNMLLLLASCKNNTFTGVTSTNNGTWTPVHAIASGWNQTNIFYVASAAAGNDTVTLAGSSIANIGLILVEVANATGIDTPTANQTNAADTISTATTVAQATELVIGFVQALNAGQILNTVGAETNFATAGAPSTDNAVFGLALNTASGISGSPSFSWTWTYGGGPGRQAVIVGVKLSAATGSGPMAARALVSGDLPASISKVVPIFSSQTYAPSPNVKALYVECVGGGGGGGGVPATSSSGAAGGGGASGSVAASFIATPAGSYTVTIGAGGTGTTGTGGNGGSTTFGSVITATGGNGGAAGASATGMGTAAGGTAGGAGTGDISLGGNPGGKSLVSGSAGNYWGAGGVGGLSPLLPSSTPQAQYTVAAAVLAGVAGGPGCGGSGAIGTGTQVATAGGAGGSGLCRVWEFY